MLCQEKSSRMYFSAPFCYQESIFREKIDIKREILQNNNTPIEPPTSKPPTSNPPPIGIHMHIIVEQGEHYYPNCEYAGPIDSSGCYQVALETPFDDELTFFSNVSPGSDWYRMMHL